jgi:alkanesulfonate monooxygenase
MKEKAIEVFTTMRRIEGESRYTGGMAEYFRKNEKFGFSGSLIFQNNSNDIEPWVLAQELFVRSETMAPFIAVNPVYMHPYTVAQKIHSFSKLYRRKVYLNFIVGTSLSDLEALNGLLQHGNRYSRLVEYIQIIRHLLTNNSPLSYEGQYYKTKNLCLAGTMEDDLLPAFFIAGSSADADQARLITDSGKIEMAKSIKSENILEIGPSVLHFGIMACDTTREAHAKFDAEFTANNTEGKQLLEMSMQNTDAAWKRKLKNEQEDELYRLAPFKNFHADCPYIVGSYNEVADYITKYIALGNTIFIIEAGEDQLEPVHTVMQKVKEKTPALL